jgi:hypothetical protein
MFNPRQPRDTGGQWVRIGRGELEQMIDALVQPRAAHIAEVNNKAGTAHRKVVARDIRARVLRPIKVAPVYHVKIAENANGHAVQVQAKGDDAVVKAVIPKKKHYGNVDVTKLPRGRVPLSKDVVNKAQFAAGATPPEGQGGVRTEAVHGELVKALPSGLPVTDKRKLGLTAVAKQAAAAKRKANLPPATAIGGATAHNREIEAALAGKAIKKAQADRLRAIVTRRPPDDQLDPELYWENQQRWALRMRRPKPDRDAIDAMLAHLGGGDAVKEAHAGLPPAGHGTGLVKGYGGVVLRRGDWVEHFQGGTSPVRILARGDVKGMIKVMDKDGKVREVHGSNFRPAPVPLHARTGGVRVDTDAEALLIFAPGAQREKLRQLFRATPRKRGENAYAYVKRVREENRAHLNKPENAAELKALRKVRENARVAVRVEARQGRHPEVIARAERGRMEAAQSLPTGERWLHGEVTDIKDHGGGINETKIAKINGKVVFVKPQAGAMNQAIHAGIPAGNDAGRERGAYLVARALGMNNVAPVVVRDVPGLGKCIVQGGVGAAEARIKGMPRTPQAEKDKRAGALLDMVIGNMDRHAGNVRVSDDRVFPIDMGLAFAEGDNVQGGWNHDFASRFWGTTLTQPERTQLENLLTDAKLWNDLKDGGLPSEAIVRTQRRVKWMLRNQKMLQSQAQMGGNKDKLGGIT